MKKRINGMIAYSLCILIVLSLAACSSNNEASSQSQTQSQTTDETDNSEEEQIVQEEPLDLTGNWAQKGKEGTSDFMAGYIKDGVIEVFWVSDSGKSGNLYWSGTYVPPTDSSDSYSWDSVNDKIKTDYALLASTDDTKTFSYENGEIKYSVSMMGQTTEVSLVPSEMDYSAFTPAGGTSGAALDGQQVVMENGVYTWVTQDNRCELFYALKVHNPNEGYAVQSPTLRITARAEDNTVLKSAEVFLPSIAANDTIVYADTVSYDGKEPASVEMLVSNSDSSYMHQEGSGVLRQDAFSISNVTEKVGDYEISYTGDITNNSTKDIDTMKIIAILKKGNEMVGGFSSYYDSLGSGQTKPFEITTRIPELIREHDSYEIYAVPVF